jgi:hypothetical protein
VDLNDLHTDNFPYKIPKGFFTPDIPEKDVYISGFHRIILTLSSKDKAFDCIGVQTYRLVPKEYKLTFENEILEITGENEIKYYHIELEDGKGVMIVDGLQVETFEPY